MPTKDWTVRITLDEQGDDTFAQATVSIDDRPELRGEGASRRNPSDESVPRIGDELAAARALSDLAHKILDVAAGDIEARTHEPVNSLQL